MQKLSACRKRFSEIQRRRSTSSWCISAICPAGPPKLRKPSFSHQTRASPKLGTAGRGVSLIAGMLAVAGRRKKARIAPGFRSAPLARRLCFFFLDSGLLAALGGADGGRGHRVEVRFRDFSGLLGSLLRRLDGVVRRGNRRL